MIALGEFIMRQEVENQKEILEPDGPAFCDCGKRGEWRACPYAVELSGLDEEDIVPCPCCSNCASQCALDV